jgi:hypothetical protein
VAAAGAAADAYDVGGAGVDGVLEGAAVTGKPGGAAVDEGAATEVVVGA